MYPQKVLHRLGDLRRGIKVLLNRFRAGFGDGFRVYIYIEEHLDWKGCHGIEIPAKAGDNFGSEIFYIFTKNLRESTDLDE